MVNTAHIISILVFIGTVLLFAGIFSYFNLGKKRKNIIEKIKNVEARLVLEKAKDVISPADRGIKKHFLKFVSSIGNKMKPKKEEDISNIRKSLLQAGYRKHNAFIVFFGFKTFFAILFPIIFLLCKVFFMKALSSVHFTALSILFAIIGFYIPNLWLGIKITRRQEKILEGFPDALDLMVVCVEAGMGLDAAINRVGEEMKLRNHVLSEEFRSLSLELRAGKPRRDALRNLAMRTGLDDVNSLMSLLIQTDKFGTSVAQALRVHSDSMRTKRYQKAEELAAKLPVKMIFPLILFILPSLFVVVVGPAIIKIFRTLLPIMKGQ